MKSVGKLILLTVFSFVSIQLLTQITFAQYSASVPQWSPVSLSQWIWFPAQFEWVWPPAWTNQPNPVILYSRAAGPPWTVNTATCYTNVTLPISKSTVDAGSKVEIYGRMYPSAIGYQIVDPQVSVYFDGNLVASGQGDWNGYYYVSFPISPFLYSGTHWITVNASIQGCQQGITTESINVNGPVSNLPYPFQYQTNVASVLLNVSDCETGKSLPSWAVLGTGWYAQSSQNGQILFSNIQPGTYNYWVYGGGYSTAQGSLSVSSGSTASQSVCLNKAAPMPAPPQIITVAVPGDDPPWASSSHESVVTPVSGSGESFIILIALTVLAGLIVLGVGINYFGRKNLMKIPEEMNHL